MASLNYEAMDLGTAIHRGAHEHYAISQTAHAPRSFAKVTALCHDRAALRVHDEEVGEQPLSRESQEPGVLVPCEGC